MGYTTTIPWTDASWSPWRICTPVSSGCANCYAAEIAARFGVGEFKRGVPRVKTKHDRIPRDLDRKSGRTQISLVKKRPTTIFPSICDPFDAEVPLEWFEDFMRLIMETPNLVWLLLTKRPQEVVPRWHAVADRLNRGNRMLPENVAIGVSAENQECLEERLSWLTQIRLMQPRYMFLSAEPLLGPIDLSAWIPLKVIDHCIVGGETGKNHRPCEVAWIEQIANQCVAAEIPVFVKQDCALKPNERGRLWDELWNLKQLPKL